jgi:hypothetical protein
MAVNIDYGLDTLQSGYNQLIQAEGKKSQAEAEKKARDAKAARQKSKGLISTAIGAGAVAAFGPAALPFLSTGNKLLMGSDAQGSDAQALADVAGLAGGISSAGKAAALGKADKLFNTRMKRASEFAKTLPAEQRVGFMNKLYDMADKYETEKGNFDPGFFESLDPNLQFKPTAPVAQNPMEIDPELAGKYADLQRNKELANISANLDPTTGDARGESLGPNYRYQGEQSFDANPADKNMGMPAPADNSFAKAADVEISPYKANKNEPLPPEMREVKTAYAPNPYQSGNPFGIRKRKLGFRDYRNY